MRSLACLSLLALACSSTALPATSDGGSDGGSSQLCDSLDEASCRATAGCVVDTCFACSCTPSFAGCRATSETPHACPPLGCAQPECCRAQSDCTNGTECVAPGASPGGGPCFMPMPCMQDSDCAAQGATWICVVVTSSCLPPNTLGCTPGCASVSDCPVGDSCDADHHCRPQLCKTDADCPRDFSCAQGDFMAPRCYRWPCSSDGDCHGDLCVEGQCYDGLGMCEIPPG